MAERRRVDWSFVVVVLLAMALGGMVFTSFQIHILLKQIKAGQEVEAKHRRNWLEEVARTSRVRSEDFNDRHFEETRLLNVMLRWWERAKDKGWVVAVEKEALEQLLKEMKDEQSKDRTPPPRR